MGTEHARFWLKARHAGTPANQKRPTQQAPLPSSSHKVIAHNHTHTLHAHSRSSTNTLGGAGNRLRLSRAWRGGG